MSGMPLGAGQGEELTLEASDEELTSPQGKVKAQMVRRWTRPQGKVESLDDEEPCLEVILNFTLYSESYVNYL